MKDLSSKKMTVAKEGCAESDDYPHEDDEWFDNDAYYEESYLNHEYDEMKEWEGG